jgi:hypothetical protein
MKKYDLVPVNGKVLLKKVRLEQDEKSTEEQGFTFAFSESDKIEVEYYQVIEMAKQCSFTFHVNDIVTVETCTPIGVFDGEEMFICDERYVTCRVLPVNDLITKK